MQFSLNQGATVALICPKPKLSYIFQSFDWLYVILAIKNDSRMITCQLGCPGDPCVGHDISPAALTGFGGWGELAVPASSARGADSITHPPAESRAAAGDGRLPGPTPTPLAVSAGWIGTQAHQEDGVFCFLHVVERSVLTLVFVFSEAATAALFSCSIRAWTSTLDRWLPDLCQTVSTL